MARDVKEARNAPGNKIKKAPINGDAPGKHGNKQVEATPKAPNPAGYAPDGRSR
jgi:hypothetical protein